MPVEKRFSGKESAQGNGRDLQDGSWFFLLRFTEVEKKYHVDKKQLNRCLILRDPILPGIMAGA